MIELYIDDKAAILADDFAMDITFENTYFTKSSNYSYEVELLMPENNHIFGPLNRATVDKERVTFPAKLIHQGRRVLNGIAIVLSVDNTTVKLQLVAGNAEFNFLTTDCYIDELDLGRELIYTEPGSYFQFANAKKHLCSHPLTVQMVYIFQ